MDKEPFCLEFCFGIDSFHKLFYHCDACLVSCVTHVQLAALGWIKVFSDVVGAIDWLDLAKGFYVSLLFTIIHVIEGWHSSPEARGLKGLKTTFYSFLVDCFTDFCVSYLASKLVKMWSYAKTFGVIVALHISSEALALWPRALPPGSTPFSARTLQSHTKGET